jgi:acyl-CoA thioester hydrolase
MPSSEYRLNRRVNFYETDAAGIVHFSWYFRYMEEAEHALWRSAGLPIHSPESEIGFPRVATSFDFHSPLRFGDEFEIWLRISAISRKSIKYVCLLSRDGEKVATGTLVIACVRHRPNEPMIAVEIPPDIAGRFQIASGVEV